MDAPVPVIETPILVPKPFVSRSTVGKIYDKTKSEINKFAKWIEGVIPEEPKRVVNEKLEELKAKVGSIFGKIAKNKLEIRETNSAIKGFTKQYTICGTQGVDAASFLAASRPQVVSLLGGKRQTKVNLVLNCTMEHMDIKTGEVTTNEPSVNEVVLESTDVSEIFNNARDKILELMASYQMRGSNWRFRQVVNLEINAAVYKPFKGSSYLPLPKFFASKKAIINMENKDEECFKWCITRALNPVERDSERIMKALREQSEKLDWSGIEFPVAADANIINKFERNNGIGVNVFGYEQVIFPIYVSKRQDDKISVVDLLLISNDHKYIAYLYKKHYCWIKNFNRLMAMRTETNHRSTHYCKRCLLGYRDVKALSKHPEYCSLNNAQKIELP